jgi:hypothetical protein
VTVFDGLVLSDSVDAVRDIESKKTEKDGKTERSPNFCDQCLAYRKFGDHSVFSVFSVQVGTA